MLAVIAARRDRVVLFNESAVLISFQVSVVRSGRRLRDLLSDRFRITRTQGRYIQQFCRQSRRSNPPYVAPSVAPAMRLDVLHMPALEIIAETMPNPCDCRRVGAA
jgi:hypothetical protein